MNKKNHEILQDENPEKILTLKKKEKRDYFSDKEQIESGPDRNAGTTQSQRAPKKTGMDYFKEGEGGEQKETRRRKSSFPNKKAA